MNHILLTTFLIIAIFSSANAQTDTLQISMKNKSVVKIALTEILKIQFENLTSAGENQSASSNLNLGGNYPNPFIEQTNIDFEIASAGDVKVLIYDNSGKYIQSLNCPFCQSGKNTLQWNCLDINGNRVQSGVYYYEVHFRQEVQSRRMLVIK